MQKFAISIENGQLGIKDLAVVMQGPHMTAAKGL